MREIETDKPLPDPRRQRILVSGRSGLGTIFGSIAGEGDSDPSPKDSNGTVGDFDECPDMNFNVGLGFASQNESNIEIFKNFITGSLESQKFVKYKEDWDGKFQIPAKIAAESQQQPGFESIETSFQEPQISIYHKIHGGAKPSILQSEAIEDELDATARNPDQFQFMGNHRLFGYVPIIATSELFSESEAIANAIVTEKNSEKFAKAKQPDFLNQRNLEFDQNLNQNFVAGDLLKKYSHNVSKFDTDLDVDLFEVPKPKTNPPPMLLQTPL